MVGLGCWRRVARAFTAELGSSLRRWASLRLVDYVVGLRYTYVELEGGWCGAAATPYWLGVERLGFLDMRAPQPTPNTLARMALETGHPLAFSLLIAAANAATSALIASQPTEWLGPGDVASIVEELGARRVVMVGFMEELAARLRRAGVEVEVAEADRQLAQRASLLGFRLLGGLQLFEALGKADAVVASGSMLVDPCTATEILEASRGPVVLVGPTSSFHPRIACRLGASWVAGVYYDRRVCWALRRAVAQAGGPHSAGRVWGVRLPGWAARATC
jgi:uncharacterized protein (DUF4213/DUF364 family)